MANELVLELKLDSTTAAGDIRKVADAIGEIDRAARQTEPDLTSLLEVMEIPLEIIDSVIISMQALDEQVESSANLVIYYGNTWVIAGEKAKKAADPKPLKVLEDKMQDLSKVLTSVSGIFKELGDEEMQKHFEALSKIFGGIATILGGITANNPLIVLKGIADVIAGIIKLSDKWAKEAEDALRGLSGVTVVMEGKLKKLAKEMRNTERAFHALMAEFIKSAYMSDLEDFSGWADKVSEMGSKLLGYVDKMNQMKESGETRIGWLTTIEDLERGIDVMAGQLGEAFSALVSRADQLKAHGSKAMVDIILQARELREEGVNVHQVFKYVEEKLTAGAKAFQTYLGTFEAVDIIKEVQELEKSLKDTSLTAEEVAQKEQEIAEKLGQVGDVSGDFKDNFDFMQTAVISTFSAMREEGKSYIEIVKLMGDDLSALGRLAGESGLEVSEGFKEMTDLASFIQQNEDLVTRLEATQTMMQSWGDSSYLTMKDFNSFATQATDNFTKLQEAGASEKEALRLLAPQLENLIKYSETYGFTIDEQTQALIDKAQTENVLNEKSMSDSEKQISLLEQLVTLLGGDIPYEVEALGTTVSDVMDQSKTSANDFQDALDQINTPELEMQVETKSAVTKTEGFKGLVDAIKSPDLYAEIDTEDALGQASGLKETLGSITAPDVQMKASWEVDEFPRNKIPSKFNVPIDWDFPKFPSIPKYAVGTDGWIEIKKPTLFLAGEGGEPEYMNIIPKSKMADRDYPSGEGEWLFNYRNKISDDRPHAGNGDIVFEHITIQSENGEEAVKDFMTAIKNNKYGVKNLIRKVAR